MTQTQPKKQDIFKLDEAFSTFAVKDLAAAKKFYGETLGFEVADEKEGGISLKTGKAAVYVYPKPDHSPATFTVFNIPVSHIESAVDELASRGAKFESYTGEMKTDDKGIFRDEANAMAIAWFKDPSGNILSVIQMN